MVTNRVFLNQPDYVFTVVRPPIGWIPQSLEDIPNCGEVLSVYYVASYDEAHDDLVRSNRLAKANGLNKWAVIHSTDGQL